jgi:3-phenylpropionate/trans-cinnamate dioxygenase ferredoxin reductase subunit
MSRKIVVIGAGPAAVAAALGAKQQDASAEVLLLSDEHCEPYEKPPLSKAVLTGKATPHDAPIAGPQGVAGHDVVMQLETRAANIDRTAHAVITREGKRIPYDALVLATGATARIVPLLPDDQDGIYYLRTIKDSLALKAHLGESRSVLVVGGGLIGLEVAASAAELGRQTTVVEIAPRIMARVCDPETSALVHARHTESGVDIRLSTAVKDVSRSNGNGFTVTLSDGGTLEADLIVVGTGSIPDDELARMAGLAVEDGIIIDDHCRTSDPAIFAAGDCTRFPGPHGPVRLENWRHAQEQGAVAGRNAAAGDAAYNVAPSYWSEQYELYIQGAGWPIAEPSQRVRRQLAGGATILFELDGAYLTHVVGINAQRDVAMARRLIERRVPVDPEALADPNRPLNAMLKAKS